MKSVVFAMPGNELLATEIAVAIHAENGEMTVRKFPDGETYVRVLSDVREKEVIIICSLEHPDEKLLTLYFLSRTLKSLGAEKICLVAPYLAYMRQDIAFNPGEGITSGYFASLISGFADALITIDPHLHRRHDMSEIYSIPAIAIHASSLISGYISRYVSNPLLIGPDAESEQWVSEVAGESNAPYVVLEKVRLDDRAVQVTIPFLEKYRNHTPVLVDDIISTAGTMIETVKHLKQAGMQPAVCIGVHAVFAGNAYHDLVNAGVQEVVTCNTIFHQSNRIDVAQLIVNDLMLFLSK